MSIKFYDLAGADERLRFSPFCWRIRLALRHKGLDFETIAWRFVEKEKIAFAKSEKVPVLLDGDRVVIDSWVIAEYLETAYADRPSLFGGPRGKATARFVTDWAECVLNAGVFPMLVADIFQVIDEGDKAYFRASREARVKTTLEACAANRDQRLPAFRQALAPLRAMLDRQPFIAGEAPAWPDIAVFSAFQWARCCSSYELLAADDTVQAWRERMLDAYDGEGRRALAIAS